MPRETRKRGKKKKQTEKVYEDKPVHTRGGPEEPSWIVLSNKAVDEFSPEAPFGYVDPDVKAYFRTVDSQIRSWQESTGESAAVDEDIDPNEQRRLFFVAALNEMHKKEKQLATDPDCSMVLERMAYSMDDFVRRVFVDSLSGAYETLAKHRFASHVCQTLFTVARDTISREARGIYPTIPEASEKGELLSLTQLILDISEELLPVSSSLIVDPFASHVIRSLLLLLSPGVSANDTVQSLIRSKRSAAWKAKQGSMKSLFNDTKDEGKEKSKSVPLEFHKMAQRFVQALRDQLNDNEIRALAANKVASPGLQMMLEVEADQNMTDQSGSIMDKVMAGIITACHEGNIACIEESNYLGTLLRDSNSSRILEIIAIRCPIDAFSSLWKVYFKGKLGRLSVHPVANFVLAKALERASKDQLSEACEELKGTWGNLIRTSRTNVFRAIINRASSLNSLGPELESAIISALDLENTGSKLLVAPCLLTFLPLQEYNAAIHKCLPKTDQSQSQPQNRQNPFSDPLEPKVQGSLLLQSLLKLPSPHNQFIIESLLALPTDGSLKIAHSTSGSRVFDVLLESPTVPAKAKRQFVMNFIGHYHLLVDDRIGSRVGDRCWEFADTYLKEKIARSMIPHEQDLVASYYGKFFARNLHLYTLQKKPQEWRNMQSEKRLRQNDNPTVAVPSKYALPSPQDDVRPSKRKRMNRGDNEIEELFHSTLGKKTKVNNIVTTPVHIMDDNDNKKDEDAGLQDVLSAIRAAPKSDNRGHRKERKP